MTPDEIRDLRLARSWTQRTLAGELGVSEDTVRSWERGRRTPAAPQLARLRELQSPGFQVAPGSAIAGGEDRQDSRCSAGLPAAGLDSSAPLGDAERTGLLSRLAAWEEEGRRLLETGELRRDVIARLLGVTGDTHAILTPPVDAAHLVAPSTSCPECDVTGWHRIPGTVQTCRGRFSLPSWTPCKTCNPRGKRPLPSRRRG